LFLRPAIATKSLFIVLSQGKLACAIAESHRGEYIGTAKASDEAAALKAALKAFPLDKNEVDRLLIRQCR
jgi:hypothetical protein